MKTSPSTRAFTLVELAVVVGIVAVLFAAGLSSLVSYLRIGSHQASTLVGMGKLQTLFAQLERDIRDARPRGDVPLLLDDVQLRAIDFEGSTIEFAELPKPIHQHISSFPGPDDRVSTTMYVKAWKYAAGQWGHNGWPQKFCKADDDWQPFGVPDLDRVAGTWYRTYEETFSAIYYPAASPKRLYFAIFRTQGWAIYTYYLAPSEKRPAGSVWRWEEETGKVSCVAPSGITAFSATPSFEFIAFPGDSTRNMELVKSAVKTTVTATEADGGNAIAARPLTLSRRVYPPALQSAPYRTRWVGR